MEHLVTTVRGGSSVSKTVSIKEASRLLGVSVKTLRRWEKEGHLSPFRNRLNHRRYPIEQLKSLKTSSPRPLQMGQKRAGQWLTFNEAADHLGVSVKTLRRLNNAGTLTFSYRSKNRLYIPRAILTAINSLIQHGFLFSEAIERVSQIYSKHINEKQNAYKINEIATKISKNIPTPLLTCFIAFAPLLAVTIPIILSFSLGKLTAQPSTVVTDAVLTHQIPTPNLKNQVSPRN